MRLVLISDTHFGDPDSTLVQRSGTSIQPGLRYQQFKQAAGAGNDYLVLVGDIFDFSVASYDEAYRCAQGFFQQIQKDNIAKRLLYLAGNHDADMWHILQHQRSVIKRLENHKLPTPFEHAISAILDDRTSSNLRSVVLDKITRHEGEEPYGGMFLDDITDPPTTFYFAYPNLYIATQDGSVLVTHGQYLEPYWAILGEMIPEIADKDIPPADIDMEEMVELNFPLNQLGCTGVGQAGILTTLVRKVEKEVAKKELNDIDGYFDRLITIIDEKAKLRCLAKLIVNCVLKGLKKKLLKGIGDMSETRYSEDFLDKPDVQKRFRNFYEQSLRDIDGINKRTGVRLPQPDKIIFGHTHQPIAWSDPLVPPDSVFSRPLKLYNMGGWLETGGKFCGAEVFIYESGKGFSSVSIR